jgi:hypothetical protein
MQKVSSEDSGGSGPHLLGMMGSSKTYKRFAETLNQVKPLELDPYEDRVACNCSILKVIGVNEPGCNGGIPKVTIMMGTYDGHLYAMRMVIKEEGYS